MTHIDPRVKEDSLLFLDVLARNCNSALMKDSYRILLNFLSMICRLHNEVKPGTKLTTRTIRKYIYISSYNFIKHHYIN